MLAGKASESLLFECECQLCLLPAPERLISDMRRRLLRYLYAAIWGSDLEAAPKKLDPAHALDVIATQTRSWHNEARLTIALYLLATIANAEGIVMKGKVSQWYAEAAMMLIKRTRALGLQKLPEPAMVDVRAWWQRYLYSSLLSPVSLCATNGRYCGIPSRLWDRMMR